ncbi:MAG TPA: SCO family protein [Steroidobacteraceae bacterium]|jgi:protein SCO1/2|nr:SCO family protein [Steroidobacteraceae bacterium]
MTGRSLRKLALAAVLSACVAAAAAAAPALKAGVFDPPRQAPDFSLQGSNGQPLQLSQYRGKAVLLAFGYSHCLSVCPITLHTFAQTLRQLGTAAAGVQVVYVTVDPQRDTAAKLQAFVSGFDPRILGGTGTDQQLAQVRKDYGVTATRIPDGNSYMYDHSSSIYLIDRVGRLRALMPYGHPSDDFVHDLRILLGE